MLDLVKENPDLILLTSDVSTSAGLDRFRKSFPNNYIDVGIAEQNLISVASGLSSEGFKTVTTMTTDKRTGITTVTKSRQRKSGKAAGKLINPKKRYGV